MRQKYDFLDNSPGIKYGGRYVPGKIEGDIVNIEQSYAWAIKGKFKSDNFIEGVLTPIDKQNWDSVPITISIEKAF